MVKIISNDCVRPRFNYFIDIIVVILAFGVINPFFATITKVYSLYYLAFLLIICFRRKRRIFDLKIVIILLIVYVIALLQALFFSGFSLALLYVPLIFFYIPYLIYKIEGVSFFKHFVSVLFVISLYTTPLWFFQCTIPAFDNFLRGAIEWAFPVGWNIVPRSLLFYTAAWDDTLYNASLGIYRNSGVFHEPGAYANILCLGIVVNTYLTGHVFDIKNKVFLFCLLTTLSTAGYFALFLIAVPFLWRQRLNSGIKVLIIFVFLIFSYNTYKSEEFLQSKVESQLEDQSDAAEKNMGKYQAQSGRFYAFYTSLSLFFDNPIIGRGIVYATSEKATGEMNAEASYVYGIIGFFKTYGGIFGLIFIYYFYQGFKTISLISKQPNYMIIVPFIAINLALSTQIFIITTIYATIFIIGLYRFEVVQGNEVTRC